MTLNTAQYLAPLNSQQVLPGYVQGVSDGNGVTIAANGSISLNPTEASSVLGFLVSSNSVAPVFNWSTVAGTQASILTNDGLGNVYWAANYVQTFPIGGVFPQTGAARMPVGTTAQRPAPALKGFVRYSDDTDNLEWSNGTNWLPLSPPTGGVFSTVSSVAPTPHAQGDLWYDTTSGSQKVWDGTAWISVASVTPTYTTFDDMSGQFDGLSTTFTLKVGGVNRAPIPSTNIMVFVGGVAQIPSSAYSVTGSSIIFTSPPPPGVSFYATTVTN